jgi:protoporphyrin/coproporphyrin ferrochelatase
MPTEDAVLLMAYGTPEHLSDVAEYFTHIRGGRRPEPEAVAHLEARYARVGGGTPLRRITEEVRVGLEARLAEQAHPRDVYIGMKHWHPYIGDTVRQMHAAGVKRMTALVLAPHYSRMSVGAYQKAVLEAADALSPSLEITFVDRWHDNPLFIDLIATRVRAARDRMMAQTNGSPLVVFSAHSLPIRIREWGDPYEAELLESSAAVAHRLGLTDWRFAWQSAGGTREPWIGPDILEYLEVLHAEGVRDVLQVPIGFVSDHLEILYDIDIEAKQRATELGMTLERTALPNADSDFIAALAGIVLT